MPKGKVKMIYKASSIGAARILEAWIEIFARLRAVYVQGRETISVDIVSTDSILLWKRLSWPKPEGT